MSFQSFLHGIARAFTVPKAVRQKINANPLAPIVKVALSNELGALIGSAVDHNVSDPSINEAIKNEITSLVSASGALK